MGTRTAPEHVLRALRGYDPRLGLEWCPRTAAWYLTQDGRRLFAWQHRDGSLALNDLSVTEALEIVARGDPRRPERHARWAAMEKRFGGPVKGEYSEAEWKREIWAAARREVETVERVRDRGPKGFSFPAGGPAPAAA